MLVPDHGLRFMEDGSAPKQRHKPNKLFTPPSPLAPPSPDCPKCQICFKNVVYRSLDVNDEAYMEMYEDMSIKAARRNPQMNSTVRC